MSIGRDEVVHVANLAEVGVSDDELPALVEQLNRIVDFVAELGTVEAGEEPPFLPGPQALTLRPDVVAPEPLTRPPADLAPEFREGFFVVPRLGAMEGE